MEEEGNEEIDTMYDNDVLFPTQERVDVIPQEEAEINVPSYGEVEVYVLPITSLATPTSRVAFDFRSFNKLFKRMVSLSSSLKRARKEDKALIGLCTSCMMIISTKAAYPFLGGGALDILIPQLVRWGRKRTLFPWKWTLTRYMTTKLALYLML